MTTEQDIAALKDAALLALAELRGRMRGGQGDMSLTNILLERKLVAALKPFRETIAAELQHLLVQK